MIPIRDRHWPSLPKCLLSSNALRRLGPEFRQIALRVPTAHEVTWLADLIAIASFEIVLLRRVARRLAEHCSGDLCRHDLFPDRLLKKSKVDTETSGDSASQQ